MEALRHAKAATLPRVGIVGGGLAGLACGWLLDGVADVVLFEDRPTLGGHAHTIAVEVGNQNILVGVGAQFFGPGPHPTYSKLLELIGLTNPGNPAEDATLPSEISITVMGAGETRPRFVSPAAGRSWPLLAAWNRDALLAFFIFAFAARDFTEDGDSLVPLDTWLSALPVGEAAREKLLLPLVGAMVGSSIEEARGLSAKSALAFVGPALPDNPLAPFVYNHSLVGLGGNVRFLAGIGGNLTAHLGSPVTSVHPLPQPLFAIRNAAGALEIVDQVILATPPYVTRFLHPRIPALRRIRWLLRRFEYFRTEIVIHRDPAYMPQTPSSGRRTIPWSKGAKAKPPYGTVLSGPWARVKPR